MTVVCKSQTIMTDILGCINRLGHGADTKLLQHMLLGFAFHVVQHQVERGCNTLGRFGVEGMTVFFCKLNKRREFFFVRCIMYPVRKRNWFLLDFYFRYMTRHGSVGEQHEFFYQLM